MPTRTDRQTYPFPDGSEIEFAIRTDDATVFRVFRADMERRAQRAGRLLGPTGVRAGATVVPTRQDDTRQSTTTYSLPGGEVTVSIDASRTGRHAYLRSLVQGAVEYTRSLHVETRRATLLAALCLVSGFALLAVDAVVPSLPFFGVGGTVAFHLLVYWLSARGIAPNLSQIPEPGHSR